MSAKSTFRSQFVADVDEIRRRRKLLNIAECSLIPALMIVFVAAVFIHPLVLLLAAIPILFLRIAHIRSLLAACPKCGHFFFDQGQYAFAFRRSECAHCGFVV